jgi:pimeloyl-ACP methyl ester carboxylesterase
MTTCFAIARSLRPLAFLDSRCRPPQDRRSALAQANLNTGHVTLELEAPLAVSDLETAFGAPRRVYPDYGGAPVELFFSLPVAARSSPRNATARCGPSRCGATDSSIVAVVWTDFTTHDDGPLVAGRRAGSGPPVLLLHGGPGLGFEYLRDLAEELAEENDVAWYQQRGQEPSAAEGPYTVATDVEDARRVLDALGWQKAYVVGHSWGGHLALHVAEAIPERLLGVLAVDPLGSVGDGRWPEFDEEMFRRTPEDVRARARELDELSTAGEADDELALEGMRLVWPAYFADPERAPPMPDLRIANERSAQMIPSILADLPALEAGLPGIRVPVGFIHGSLSPMPLGASADAAERIPGAWVEVVDGAGHFIWVEAPGAVRAALRRLTAG